VEHSDMARISDAARPDGQLPRADGVGRANHLRALALAVRLLPCVQPRDQFGRWRNAIASESSVALWGVSLPNTVICSTRTADLAIRGSGSGKSQIGRWTEN
jgi:hypothetical protein